MCWMVPSRLLFLSTLSLRRATCVCWMVPSRLLFLSTLSLRRATALGLPGWLRVLISIHALLAESDFFWFCLGTRVSDFYPRSPCGERQPTAGRDNKNNVFLSTLSLRRATTTIITICTVPRFLSTLSLRRATLTSATTREPSTDFYPRSPCGERQLRKHTPRWNLYFYPRSPCGERRILGKLL